MWIERYECIEDFIVEKCDDNGSWTEEYMIVESGSIWSESDGFKIVGGEIRLENYDDNKITWLEISKENLNKRFRLLED